MQRNSFSVTLRLFLVMTIITGIIYPAVITVVGRMAFPWQSGGSIMIHGSTAVGSLLIAQPSNGPRYFAPRPSAGNYATVPSAASNYAVSNAALHDSLKARAQLRKKPVGEMPSDLLFSSGSGLDPHLSPEAALFQADQIARLRGLSAQKESELKAMIISHVEKPQFGALGNARVNVLLLNCYLDRLRIARRK
jgi:K+-transporting ATPase ATPase C chain